MRKQTGKGGAIAVYDGEHLKVSAPKSLAPSDGCLQKARQIANELDECLQFSARIRSDLLGEAESGQGVPVADNLQGLLHDILANACNLRGELQTIASGVSNEMKKQIGNGKTVHNA